MREAMDETAAYRWCTEHHFEALSYHTPARDAKPERRGVWVTGWAYHAGKDKVRVSAIAPALVEAVAKAKAAYDAA